MEQFLQKMEKTFSSGDPELMSWFFIRNTYLPFILCGLYGVFSIVIGPAIMKNRKPFKLRNIMIVFNFFLVLNYTVCIVVFFWNLRKGTWTEFCNKFVIKKGHLNYKLAVVCWWVYVIKYIELFDTVFFILRKKENLVTFLHVFHHTIVPIAGWSLFRTETGAIQAIPGYINAFVHVFMYTYYGLAAMGPEYKKYLWWKKYLTQLQMIQFLFIVAFETVVVPLSGCQIVQASYLIYSIFPVIFFILFYNFYKRTFALKRSPSSNGETRKGYVTNGRPLENGEEKRGIAIANERTKME